MKPSVEAVRAHYGKINMVSHLGYFSLVAFGGPYNIAAGVCLTLGVVGWIFFHEEL